MRNQTTSKRAEISGQMKYFQLEVSFSDLEVSLA